MSLEDLFPKTIFVREYIKKYGVDKAITKQIGVVIGELLEVQDASSRGDYNHTREEVIDAMTATMQILYMLPGHDYDEVLRHIDEVQNKNDDRGYYEKSREKRSKGR